MSAPLLRVFDSFPRLLAIGAALFAAALPRAQDDRWSDEFNVPGLLGNVLAIADFRGDLVAAGTVGAGRGAFVDRIAVFDGTRWRALPGTFSNTHQYPYNTHVLALAVYQNDLIVAGRFTTVGQATTAFGVARFDGTRWWNMAQGFPNAADVNALGVFGGQLYAGGNFSGSAGPAGIAMWNGSAWVPVGGPMQFPSDGVRCLRAASDGTLWVGGDFTHIGAVPFRGIARWTGTQWLQVGRAQPGGGFATGDPWAFEEFQGRMIIGGGFNDPGNLSGVAAWNGTDLVPIGSGPNDAVSGFVSALQATPRGLYIGGDFLVAGGVPVHDLVRFDGAAWHDDGGDDDGGYAVYSVIHALHQWNGALVVGGDVSVLGSGHGGGRGRPTSGLGTFDGTTWSTLGDGLGMQNGGAVHDIVPWRGGWAIVGNFSHGGDVITSRLSWFDGRRHHHLADFNSTIASAHVWQGDLVVSGDFAYVNGTPATRTMRFDGTNWTSMGNVLAADFAEFQGQLYASAGGLVRWNGTGWNVLAQIGESHDLAVFQNRLYLGGLFSYFQTDGLFEWDGTTFRTVPNGPNSHVHCLLVRNSELWLGGEFSRCGAATTRCLARFDGTNFNAIGTGIAGPQPGTAVAALAELDGQVYVGGSFSTAAGGPANYIARWDGVAFRPLGNGVNASVTTIEPDPITGDLLVGGTFFAARAASPSATGAIPASKLTSYRTRDAWTDLGGGLGVATLIGRGALRLGGTVGWRLHGAPPAANGMHILSFRRVDLPFLGGVLVPGPDVSIGFTTSPLGTAELGLSVPTALPPGTPLFCQSWFLDTNAPAGVAASNAVTIRSN